MKLAMRNWPWLAALFAVGLICTGYLLAQTQSPPATTRVANPDSGETADCNSLIDAINAGDDQTVMNILKSNGIADATVQRMTASLGQSTATVLLPEPFLKVSVGALALADRSLNTNLAAIVGNTATALGYQRPVWMPRRPDTWTIASFDDALAQCPVPPILVLNIRTNDPCLIRYFRLYDRYADSLHSVVLNGPNLSNAKLDPSDYPQANRELNALFQLIKARKPDAFVWLSVVKRDDHSDERWLKAMTFTPDGLQISNLRQFHSPFGETRNRYAAIVGTNMPMLVSGFEGYTAALENQKAKLAAAITNQDLTAATAAKRRIGGIGVQMGQNLGVMESDLQTMGYRGLSLQWTLIAALANSNNAVAVGTSNLVDPRSGWLDFYISQKDYAHAFSLATDLSSNAVPGDMNWTVGKLYQSIVLISHSPPRYSDANPILDTLLSFNFQNRPGRDHYILGAAKWRIYSALSTGDMDKARQLAQWVQATDFREDLKSDFLKNYQALLTPASIPQN